MPTALIKLPISTQSAEPGPDGIATMTVPPLPISAREAPPPLKSPHGHRTAFVATAVFLSLSTIGYHSWGDDFRSQARNDHNQVRLLSTIVGADRSQSGNEAKVTSHKEAVIDFETESVVFLMETDGGTKPPREQELPLWRIVPFTLDQDKLDKVLPIEIPNPFTRAFASQLFRQQNAEPYWTKHVRNLRDDLRKLFDTTDFPLVTFSELKGQIVEDRHLKKVGKLVDFGVRDSDQTIIYGVVATAAKTVQLRAIPLAAFVRNADTAWKIELDRQQILNFEPFSADQPPQKLERGWEEYVAVRYGRSGVQTAEESSARRE